MFTLAELFRLYAVASERGARAHRDDLKKLDVGVWGSENARIRGIF